MKFHIMTIAGFIAAMINFSPVYGWSYPGSGSIALGGGGPGDVISSFDARTLSMGGSSMAAAHGIAGVFYNPALLSLRQRRGVMVGGYGNFSSQVVTGGDKYRSASSNYNIPLVGAMLPMGNLRLALGYSKLFDMAYTSENKTYTLGKPNTLKIENKGGPGRMILGASSKLFGKLNAGLSMNMIMGGSEGSVSEIEHEVSRISLDTDRDLSGMFLQLGGVYSLKRDLAHIGLTFAPSYTMTDSWKEKATTSYWSSSKEEWGSPVEAEAKGKAELTMPSVLGLGIQYNFLGLDRTLITADIQRTDWSSFRYEEKDASAAGYGDKINPNYRDTTRFSVGAEHYLNFTTAIRTGFSYEPFYGDRAVDQTSFTAGAGFELSRDMFLDLAGSIGYRTYSGANPFVLDEDKTVSESRVKLMASLEWLF